MKAIEITVALIALLVIFSMGKKANHRIETLEQYIADQCKMYDIESEFVHKLISAESSWRPYVISPKGYRGLMQLGPLALEDYNARFKTAYKIEDLFNPHINVRVGIWYLSWIRDNFTGKNKQDVLICYNWGVGHYKIWDSEGRNWEKLPWETRDLIKKVLEIEIAKRR